MVRCLSDRCVSHLKSSLFLVFPYWNGKIKTTCLTFSLRIIIIRCPINGYNLRTLKVAAKRLNCWAEKGPRHSVVLRILLKPPGSHINPQQTRRREGRGRGSHVALGRLNLHQGSLLFPDPTLLSIIYLPWKYGAQYGREQTVCCTSSVCVCVCHMVAWTPPMPH